MRKYGSKQRSAYEDGTLKSLANNFLLSLFHFNIVLLSPAKAIKHEAKIRAVTTGEKNIKNKITRD